MFLKLNIIRNKFQEALEEAEKNHRLCRHRGFNMNTCYAFGIFAAMCLHRKLVYLPANNIARMMKLRPDLQDIFDSTIDLEKSLSEEKLMRTISETFSALMRCTLYPDISIRHYGMAKGILFVMKELGTISYLDQEMVITNESIEESVAGMIEASDGMYDYLTSLVGGND